MRLAYNVLLRREPDDAMRAQYVGDLAGGNLTPWDVVDRLRASDEYRARTPIGGPSLLQSLHLSRCEFISSLPPARSILDLGGSHSHNPWGALVLLGYPYDFEQLTIVDLPPQDRHSLYQSEMWQDVTTPRGPVHYEFRSMIDLSFAADESIDLVYSGQSIEHVEPEKAKLVLKEVLRVLRPGGWLAIDTPNAAVCRLQTPELIDPDHKVEYTLEALTEQLDAAGFEVVDQKGLNLARRCLDRGVFDPAEAAGNYGVFADAAACYLLALVARRPTDG